jgi:hypothetical protein
MTKDESHRSGAACGTSKNKAPAADKSAKKEIKSSKPEKKGK